MKNMKSIFKSKKRLVLAASVALIFTIAVCLGASMMRQNYEAHHYVTLTMEDDKGHITHEKVSQQRLEQINKGANKMYKDITEQVDRERVQKGLLPIQHK